MGTELIRGRVQPNKLASDWSSRFAYSYGFRHGNMLWIAGQIARDGKGMLVGVGNIEAQAVQVFENIQSVLEEAGATMSDLVSTTTYITSRPYRETVTEVRHRYLKGPHYPTNTLLIVQGLGLPEYLVEIEAVAVLRGSEDA
ncbi:RidA family protein [Bradyrhizobium sp. LA7.1]|uniref:RidA family protein n=1 Tax=Bradyrhizobium sp. LA7.1 TaxID=3156324 RepID=UPI003392E47A